MAANSSNDSQTSVSPDESTISCIGESRNDDDDNTTCPNQEHPKQLPEEQLRRLWKLLREHNLRGEDLVDSPPASQLGNDDVVFGQERNWPNYDKVMADVALTDYTEVLQCPFDVRERSASSNEKKLCPYGAVCCAKMELFPQPEADGVPPYSGLLTPGQTVEHAILRLSSAIKPPSESFSSSALGKVALAAAGKELRGAKLFPCAALKVFRADGVRSGNLLFAGRKVVCVPYSAAFIFHFCVFIVCFYVMQSSNVRLLPSWCF